MLNMLVPAGKKRKRIGRGGSRGGTSGRGHQGQGSRTGDKSVGAVFEGGQMPLSRRLPKRGFNNYNFRTEYQLVQLEQIEAVFKANDEVSKTLLKQFGLISSESKPVKILGNGSLSKKLTVHVDAASKPALKAIEDVGGKVIITKEK
jgi:large subunit ribosomal protein L15